MKKYSTFRPRNAKSKRHLLSMILKNHRQYKESLTEALELVNQTDAEVREYMHETASNEEEEEIPTESLPEKKVFCEEIKDHVMADAMYEVCERALGDSKEAKQFDLRPIDLMAYLFIMIDLYGYGRYDFHKNGKRPFFQFFIDFVKPDWDGIRGITRKTMGNRINDDFDCLYLSEAEKKNLPAGVRKHYECIEKDFQTVCGIFHSTRLGKILKKHKETSVKTR